MRALVVALAAAVLAAGCLAAPAADDAADAAVAPAAAGPLDLQLLTDAPAAGEPSLDAPPQWRTGEWWRIRVTDMFTGEVSEVTKVVAGAVGDHYVVGQPAEGYRDDLIILHIPGFTEVNRGDLSHQVHNSVFTPLRFPVTDGDSWETAFHNPSEGGGTLTAVATVVSPTVAEVEMAGTGGHIALTYDAEVGHITRFVHDRYGAYEVVDHGYDYEGDVAVAVDQRVVFLSARAASAVGVQPVGPAAPVETATVDAGWNRISLVLLSGSLVGDAAQPGVYATSATAPDGTAFETLVTPADAPGFHSTAFSHGDPAGTWQFRHVGAGPGVTLVEGIAHNAYTVRLPAGDVSVGLPG